MKELVNLSNYHLDNLLINNSAEELQKFLREHNLSGLEMLFYENWDEQIHKKDFADSGGLPNLPPASLSLHFEDHP